MSKKSIIILVLITTLLVSFSTPAFAYTKSFNGTRAYTFIDSDLAAWPVSYDWYTYEYWTYSTGYNKISKHTNDGTLNNAKNIPVDQDMDNSSSFQQKSSSTATTYNEIGRINFYEWLNPGPMILPADDIYFLGCRNDKTFSLKSGLGKVYYYWALYVSEGWWGAARYFTANKSFTL